MCAQSNLLNFDTCFVRANPYAYKTYIQKQINNMLRSMRHCDSALMLE